MPRLGQMEAPRARIVIVGERSPNKLPSGIGSIGRLTATLAVAPGDIIEVSQVTLTYQGPEKLVAVGVAWKPKTGFLGTDFNNGKNILSAAGAIGFVNTVLRVSSAPQPAILPGGARLTVPAPGSYPLIGGGTGTINEGDADVWLWLVDKTKGDNNQPFYFTNEANFLTPSGSISTDAAVATIKAAVSIQVSNLNAGYRKV